LKVALRTSSVLSVEALVALIPDWRRLWARSDGTAVFQAPGWVMPWFELHGEPAPVHCVAVFDDGELIGLAPLVLAERWGLRSLEFVGSAVNDRNAILAAVGKEAEVRAAVLDHLAGEAAEWDVLALDHVMPAGEAAWPGGTLRHFQLVSDVAPALALPPTWEEYFSGLSAVRRKDLEYRRRRLWRDLRPEFEVCKDAASMEGRVKRFEELRLGGWAGRERLDELVPALRSPSFSAFLPHAFRELAGGGLARIAQLNVDGEPIAASVYLVSGDRMLCYLKAYNPRWKSYGPGIVLEYLMVRDAIQSGYAALDFGRGDEPYKFFLGAGARSLGNALIAGSVRGAVAARRRQLMSSVKARLRPHVRAWRHRWRAKPA
jgi:CelD/BcsL family acetyltransferase involved in cellulose biosynthesis